MFQNWNKSLECDFTDTKQYFGAIANRKNSAPIHCPMILAQDLMGQQKGFQGIVTCLEPKCNFSFVFRKDTPPHFSVASQIPLVYFWTNVRILAEFLEVITAYKEKLHIWGKKWNSFTLKDIRILETCNHPWLYSEFNPFSVPKL